jgi:hypothetical protein
MSLKVEKMGPIGPIFNFSKVVQQIFFVLRLNYSLNNLQTNQRKILHDFS